MSFLTVVVASAALLGLSALLLLLPKTPHLTLSSFPHPAWLYWQVVVCIFTKAKVQGKEPSVLPLRIYVELVRPVQFEPRRFCAFLQLVGLEEGTGGDTPITYPIVECFRLHIQAMLLPQFPFNVLGSVLARNTTTLRRPIQPDERLLYRCEVDPALRMTTKGDVELDIIASAFSLHDAQPAWSNTLTVIILALRRRQSGPTTPAAAAAKVPPALVAREQLDVWQLAGNIGRQYGWINGDLNPIHLFPATSRLFGFKRPIAHALYLVARAEASLRKAGVPSFYPVVLEAEFKRPTLLPATLQLAWSPATNAGGHNTVASIANAAASQAGLDFAILTEDGTKEVLLGKLYSPAESKL